MIFNYNYHHTSRIIDLQNYDYLAIKTVHQNFDDNPFTEGGRKTARK